jgi:MOSC domain-containing protein
VTIHGRASVRAVGEALDDPNVSKLRFRSNVSVDGLEPFEEQGWIGKMVRVGSMRFRVHLPIGRCLATHANPETGQRDRPILTTLTHAFGQKKPTLAVGLVPEGAGNIGIGDEVLLEG